MIQNLIEKSHWGWDDFFISWFIHTVAVAVLVGGAVGAIIAFHKRILGYEFELKVNKSHELTYFVLMTIIVAAIGILLVASYGPSEDY
jgi:hypothetical protein